MKMILTILLLLISSKSFSESYKEVKLGICGPIEGMYEYLKESGYEPLPSNLGVVLHPSKKMERLYAPSVDRVSTEVGKKRSEGWGPLFWTFTDLLVITHQDATDKQKGSVCISETPVTLTADQIKDLSEYFGKLSELLN